MIIFGFVFFIGSILSASALLAKWTGQRMAWVFLVMLLFFYSVVMRTKMRMDEKQIKEALQQSEEFQ